MEIHSKYAYDLNFLLATFGSRPTVIIGLFSKTCAGIRRCVADVSDGEEGGPGIVGFCASHPNAILVPDSDFFASNGYEAVRKLTNNSSIVWNERSDNILWRGSTSGHGIITTPEMTPANTSLIQRTRLCLLLRDVSRVDAKFACVVQTEIPEDHDIRLHGAKIMGARMDVSNWLNHKFAIDIDGNSNAWSNLFQRLLLGCCVIKVTSPYGYRQWYYDELIAWRHYVPVLADLSDLLEKIDWCRENQPACAEIAAAGKEFALERTFEREVTNAINLLDKELV